MEKPYFRFLESYILEDLKERMVFIGGPRQVGKTTLSRDIIGQHHFNSHHYYNWDSNQDRQIILKEKWDDAELIIFDEIHKYRLWKNHVKGIYDKLKHEKKFILTGSSRLDVFRKGGDSLLGRYRHYRLHPFSVSELHRHHPKIEPFKPLHFSQKAVTEHVENLLQYGGFPEPLFKKSQRELRRWHHERISLLFKEDIRDLSNIVDINSVQLLVDMLPARVASLFSVNSVCENLEVSHKAVKHWLVLLESLYYAYRIYPFQSTKIRALKKEPKLYLWDWSEVTDTGARFENMIAGHLLKMVHFLVDYEGYNAELYYLRDKDKREVDFLVTIDQKPWFCIEAKVSDGAIPTSLKYFKEKLNIPFNYVVTLNGDEDYTKDGVRVLPASLFLTGMP
jgi:predicted AAA+ superfamily ATPase